MTASPKTWLFLDIDGVLNGGYLPGVGFDWHLPAAVDALNRLTDALNADIIVSSSWRTCHVLRQLQFVLVGWGVRAAVVGVTPVLGGERIEEIHAALARLEPREYVILDDNDVYGDTYDPWEAQEDADPGAWRFHLTNTKTGLTQRDVDVILDRWSSRRT